MSATRTKRPFDVITSIIDNLKWVVSTSLAGIILFSIFTFFSNKNYYSTTASLIFEPNLPEILYTDNERYLHSFEDWMRTQVHEIESNQVLQNAIISYKNEGFNWQLADESMKTAIDRLRGKVNVTQINNTQIMEISLIGPNPDGLAETVNAVVQSYINFKHNQRIEQDKKKLGYLAKEKTLYEKKLDKSYSELLKVSAKYATAVADEKNLYIYLNMFMDLKSRYNKVLLDRIEQESKLTAFLDEQVRLENLKIASIGKNPKALGNFETELKERMVGLREGTTEYEKLNQMTDQIRKANISATTVFLKDELAADIFKTKTEFMSLRESEKSIRRELGKAQTEIMQLNTAILRASTKRQEIERFITIWNRINERIEQIRIELFNPGRVRILNIAQTPEFPDPSQLFKKFGLGILGMIVLGLGIGMARGYLDNKITRPADIKTVLGIAPTGFLPDSAAEKIEAYDVLNASKQHPHSFLVESIKRIAFKIEQDAFHQKSKVFAITSIKEGAGVTSIANNLLQQIDMPANKKIYLDLNPNGFSGRENIDPQTQFKTASWLNNEASLKDIYEQREDYIYVKERLLTHNNTTISISRLALKMEELKSEYDFIVIDAPPLLLSSDSHKLVQAADVSVLVVDAQKNIWPELECAIDQLQRLSVNAISIIVNKVPVLLKGYLANTIKEYKTLRVAEGTPQKTELNNG